MQQQVFALLLFLATTRSENLYCVTSEVNSLGVVTNLLQIVDTTSGTLTPIKDITALGDPPLGHNFRWLSFGKSFSLATIDSQNFTVNYFYELSTSGDVVTKHTSDLFLVSTEIISNASVFATTAIFIPNSRSSAVQYKYNYFNATSAIFIPNSRSYPKQTRC